MFGNFMNRKVIPYCFVKTILVMSQVWWLTLKISATQEMEIGRITFGGQSGQKASKTPSQ
jgi:hypothetical protein